MRQYRDPRIVPFDKIEDDDGFLKRRALQSEGPPHARTHVKHVSVEHMQAAYAGAGNSNALEHRGSLVRRRQCRTFEGEKM